MIENKSFEELWNLNRYCTVYPIGGDPYNARFDNILTPEKWRTYFVHLEGTWDKPEVRDAWASLDARRVKSGDKATVLFTFSRKHDAGFSQKVRVTAGSLYRFSAYPHAWSNHGNIEGGHPDNPYWSDGVGRQVVALDAEMSPDQWDEGGKWPFDTGDPQTDAIPNFTFWVGIDPTGNDNPFSDTVVWSPGYHIYNGYCKEVAVEAVAESDEVVVFLRSKTRWPFKHCDAYWDDAELVELDVPSPSPSPSPTGHSKLGPHVIRGVAGLGEQLAAGPAVAKFVGDWGMALQVPSTSLVIGRMPSQYDAQSMRHMDPGDAATKYIRDHIETITSNDHIDYWEGHNEPVWNTIEDMRWYGDFEIARMNILAGMGKHAVIGNFATGTPPESIWPGFVKACEVGFKWYEAILGLHEYSCPWMWWMTGSYQLDPNEDQGDEGWTTLRYRKVYRQFLLPGIAIPLVITECGLDPLVNPKPPGWTGGAWQDLCGEWAEKDGRDDCAAYYLEQLIWYDQELQKDDYVIGATVFSWGTWAQWEPFEVGGTPVGAGLTAYVLENPPLPFEYPGEPSPPPTECRGAPREQYERSYLLMPPDAGVEWAHEVLEATWDRRMTLGGSADDAGIGDLDVRNVIILNGELWGGDIDAFYEEHYPGVSLEHVSAVSPAETYLALRPRVEGDPGSIYQRDDRWREMDLGLPGGNETIGSDGCVLSCVCDLLREVAAYDALPDKLNQLLVDGGAFYAYNLIDWSVVGELFSPIKWEYREDRRYTESELQAFLRQGYKVVAAVQNGAHFVYVLRVDGNLFECRDPWFDRPVTTRPISDVSGVRLYSTVDGIVPDPDVGDRTIGVHGAPVTGPPPRERWAFWIDEMKAMGVKWYKSICMDYEWLVALNNAGITPVVRLYQPPRLPKRLPAEVLDRVPRLVQGGIKYFEIMNEPNLDGEWESQWAGRVDYHNDIQIAAIGNTWFEDAMVVINAGGCVALPAMAPTERNGSHPRNSSVEWMKRLFDWLRDNKGSVVRSHVVAGNIWQAVHVSPFDRPFEYDPYGDGFIDDMCMRAFEVYAEIARERFGAVPDTISTEGGAYSPEHLEFLGWNPYSEEEWADRVVMSYAWLGQKHPHVLGLCSWILTDEGVADPRWKDNGWYRDMTPRLVVERMKV